MAEQHRRQEPGPFGPDDADCLLASGCGRRPIRVRLAGVFEENWALPGKTIAGAVSAYGASATAKLANIAIEGAPEDQLRGPLDTLLRDIAEIGGLPVGSVHLVGETKLTDLKTRPDFAVTVSKALVGFIEVKAPGKGADPRHFADPHDKEQWDKLKSLPNLVYTDGNAFSLWRDGKLAGPIVRLEGMWKHRVRNSPRQRV
jgi:hypothetical protein